ncbi:MAG: hypothetical protein JSU85_14440 [Candidatus Zixiibacteriota bacterium]|nr:MAG: hypothetical protein JSU85_14440 [candidate division Zixibacteria bacterium]
MRTTSSIPKRVIDLIRLLDSLKFSFSAANSGLKAQIIKVLASKKLLNPSHIIKYHEALCFMQAYPDNSEIKTLADLELAGFADRIAYFREIYGEDDERIEDAGLVDTVIRYPYNYIMTRWLVDKYGDDIDIDWEYYAENERDPLSGLLNLFALYVEDDGIDDEDLTTEEWVDTALAEGQSSLKWFLKKLDELEASFDVRQYIYDGAELMLNWKIGKSRAASTLAMTNRSVIYYQKTPMKKQRFDLRRIAKSKPPRIKLLSGKEGKKIIETQILALLPRHRELYPTLYANPSEIYVTSPGRGLEIYMVGMKPQNRMPLETNFSGLLIKNGVPIGYAISVLLFERCEIAINVFDTFRSGEASIIFNHFFKVFYHHFGGRAFLMRKWQVGHENEEGLQSGSFWFYYKLGFRPMDPKVREFAEEEAEKIRADRSYRCDIKTLKRLALSDMLVDLRLKPREPFRELLVAAIGMAVTKMIAADFASDGRKALRYAKKYALSSLGITGLSKWTDNERLQFERWSPLLVLIRDLREWSKNDKNLLIEIIRAKAAKREKRFVAIMQKHNRFREFLIGLSGE